MARGFSGQSVRAVPRRSQAAFHCRSSSRAAERACWEQLTASVRNLAGLRVTRGDGSRCCGVPTFASHDGRLQCPFVQPTLRRQGATVQPSAQATLLNASRGDVVANNHILDVRQTLFDGGPIYSNGNRGTPV
jgi:hypothetical protein